MASTTTISLRGWGELESALKELGPKAAKKAGRKALKAGGQVIVDEAKIHAPVDTGALEAAIMVAPATGPDLELHAQVGVRRGVSWRAHFVEFGTIKQAAQPFLRPALDSKHIAAIEVMGEEMWKGVDQAAKEAAKGRA